MSGWSMVWLAPVCLSSGGLSAVSRIIGTPSVAAATRGGEREPGATQKKPTPLRTSSSTRRVAQSRLARGVSLGVKPEHPGEVADFLLYPSPLAPWQGSGDDPRP